RVDDKDDQVPHLAFAHLLAQVLPLEHQGLAVLAPALYLHRGRGADRGVDREVVHLRLRLGADVAAAAVGGLARAALAALLADLSLPRQVDALQVEDLARVRRRLLAARPAGGHALVAPRGLLAGLTRALGLVGGRLGRRLAVRRLRLRRLGLLLLGALLPLALVRRRARLVVVAADGLTGPVCQCERRGVVDVLARRRVVAPVRGEGADGAVDDDVGSVAEDVGLHADRRDEARLSPGHAHAPHRFDRLGECPRQVGVRRRELGEELVVAALERG